MKQKSSKGSCTFRLTMFRAKCQQNSISFKIVVRVISESFTDGAKKFQ